MFELTLFDHLRLSFGHVALRYEAHAKIAQTRARWSCWLQALEALLMAGVIFAALNFAVGRSQWFAFGSAGLATMALLVVLVRLGFNFEASARANSLCAAQLWHMRERYKAVLSDLADGAIDLEQGRARRDELTSELAAIYEDSPTQGVAYLRRHPPSLVEEESSLTDDQIDALLPKSLHKSGATRTTTAA